MAKTTKKTAETQDLSGAAMSAAMAAFSPVAATAWFEIMQESIRFMTERLQQDLETQKAMLNCKTPADLMELQAEFYRKTLAQYTAETNRMMEMMGKAMNVSAAEAKSGHKRGYDDVPV